MLRDSHTPYEEKFNVGVAVLRPNVDSITSTHVSEAADFAVIKSIDGDELFGLDDSSSFASEFHVLVRQSAPIMTSLCLGEEVLVLAHS